jgi:hypothetical protein
MHKHYYPLRDDLCFLKHCLVHLLIYGDNLISHLTVLRLILVIRPLICLRKYKHSSNISIIVNDISSLSFTRPCVTLLYYIILLDHRQGHNN